MDKSRKSRINVTTVGAALLLIGAVLLAMPYLQSYYDEWTHPASQAQPAIARPNPPAVPERTLKDLPGRLVIPSLDLDLVVGYGVGEEELKKGPGFYPQSGYPTEGNVSIAGHRNAYGNPFWHLNELQVGDTIELYYDEQHFIYRVDRVYVTHSRDWSVVDPTPQPALTLTTCTPLKPVDGHYDRLIVRAYRES